MKLRLYIMSDLHIGDGSKRDNYLPDTYLFKRFQQTLRSLSVEISLDIEYGYIPYLVLLGDAVNGEYGHVKCYKSPAFKLIREFIKEHPDNVLYVAGNHDNKAPHLTGLLGLKHSRVSESFLLSDRVMLMHGHQFDVMCNYKSILGYGGDVASWFVANFMSPTDEDELRGEVPDIDPNDMLAASLFPRISSISPADVKQMPSDVRLADAAAAYMSWYSEGNVDDTIPTIVCGHTHQPKIHISYARCNYYNAGKYSKDGVMTLSFDVDNDSVIAGPRRD